MCAVTTWVSSRDGPQGSSGVVILGTSHPPAPLDVHMRGCCSAPQGLQCPCPSVRISWRGRMIMHKEYCIANSFHKKNHHATASSGPVLPNTAFCLLQDTADYVKPVTFSIDYELEHPESGPVLDDGWPTSLRVSVCAAPSRRTSLSGVAAMVWARNPCCLL